MTVKPSRAELLADLNFSHRMLGDAIARVHQLEVRIVELAAANEHLLDTFATVQAIPAAR